MKKIIITLLVLTLSACATSPLGRSQMILIGDAQMNEMGVASFQKMKTGSKVSTSTRTKKYVECVSFAIIDQLPDNWKQNQWEVVVFDDDSANAFALPGGKIGVHTGLLKVAKNQDQLATVLGHEVAHVLSRHGAERVSQQFVAQTGMQFAEAYTNSQVSNNTKQKLIMTGLGLGAQLGVLLPFSRTHETEADLFGLDLMAAAGFDPQQSVPLWQNMDAASGGKRPPQFLSTHPEPSNRIKNLSARMERAVSIQQQARQNGNNPRCSG
ncbi:M48 family metallopeptidase [Marinicella sp. W31]|uniref:M48 family metallopeptidase n=1 Tax=Marinicella sp. W31 TaxID=3023713 RepID=UPI00375823D4